MNNKNLSIFNMLKSVFSLNAYYLTIHKTFNALFGEDQMLHYPLANEPGQSLIDGQRNLTDYCFTFFPIC